MEKRLIKRMLALGMVATMGVSTVAMIGCRDNSEKYQFEGSSWLLAGDHYIDIDEVLHKGDVYALGGDLATKLDLDCGQKVICYGDYYAYSEEPEASTYEHKCEECFGANN